MRSLCDVVIEENLIGKEVGFRTIWYQNLWSVAEITEVDREAGLIYFKDETGELGLPEAGIMYLIVGDTIYDNHEDTIYDNHEDSKYYVRLLNIANAILGLMGAIFVYWVLFKIFNWHLKKIMI